VLAGCEALAATNDSGGSWAATGTVCPSRGFTVDDDESHLSSGYRIDIGAHSPALPHSVASLPIKQASKEISLQFVNIFY